MIAPERKTTSFGNNTSLRAASFSSNDTSLRVASFSSYINGSSSAEESFMFKLTTPPKLDPKKTVDNGEIGVFGAEKYFKGAIDEELPKTDHVHDPPENLEPQKDEAPKSRSATPSVRSESSWSSRSGLLAAGGGGRDRRSRTEKTGTIKSLLASLGCNCNDKASVKISANQVHVAKQPTPMKGDVSSRKTISFHVKDAHGMKKEDGFTFPVLNSSMADRKVEGGISARKSSMEVFGSPILEKGNKSFSLERKLSMMNWDGGANNDTGSDASSDLFEIESFSTGNENPSFLARNNVTTPHEYAPSEASIERSDNADFLDFQAPKPYNTMVSKEGFHGSGVLSGCKNHKAVRVSEGTHCVAGGGQKVTAAVGPAMKQRCWSCLLPHASHRLYIRQ